MRSSLQICACKRRDGKEFEGIITINDFSIIYSKPWICYFKSIPVIIHLVLQIMTVGSKEISHTLELHILTLTRSIICYHFLQVRHHINWELAGTIEAKASHLIANHTVAETLNEALLVFLQISILWSWHVRSNIIIHKSTYKLADSFIVHGSIYLAITTEERRIREQCMGSIQERKLHIFKCCHIVCHLSTNGFPCWATCYKIILYYPLDEILAIYRSLIASTILSIQTFDVGWSCSRCDTVNHRVRESNVFLHPGCEFLVLSTYESHESLTCSIAIMLKIITRKDSDRTIACCSAAAQTLSNISESRYRIGWIFKIMSHLCIIEHEFTCLARNIISTLRDSKGNNLNIF